MKTFVAFAALFALVSAPAVAGPAAVKRPLCQVTKSPPRVAKRPEPCRKPSIPPLVDPTPFFLASPDSAPLSSSDLS